MRKAFLMTIVFVSIFSVSVPLARPAQAHAAQAHTDTESTIQIVATPGDIYTYSKLPATEHISWICPFQLNTIVIGTLLIDWRDGSTTGDRTVGAGTASKTADYTHTYQDAGTYDISILVRCTNFGGISTFADYTAHVTTPSCSTQLVEYDTTNFSLGGHTGTLGVYLESPKTWQGSCVSNGVLISVAEMRLSNGASTGRITAIIYDTSGAQHNHTDTNFSTTTYADATTTYGETCGHARAMLTINQVSANVSTDDHCV